MKLPPIGPFFSYFGGKWRIARAYPAARFGTVYELFAGGAGYSHLYYDREVILYDSSRYIKEAWEAILKIGASEILKLRTDYPYLEKAPAWAQSLIGFHFRCGKHRPHRTPIIGGNWNRWTREAIVRIARESKMVSHWQFRQADYSEGVEELCRRKPCTVFVDPPYQNLQGEVPEASYCQKVWTRRDFNRLSQACQKLGWFGHQVIVCEQAGADWLPFIPLRQIRGGRHAPGETKTRPSKEVFCSFNCANGALNCW